MKQLYKSNTDRIIFGVCGGIGEFLGISGTIVRLLFIIFTLAGGSGILLYILAAIIIPRNKVYVTHRQPQRERQRTKKEDVYKNKEYNVYQTDEEQLQRDDQENIYKSKE